MGSRFRKFWLPYRKNPLDLSWLIGLRALLPQSIKTPWQASAYQIQLEVEEHEKCYLVGSEGIAFNNLIVAIAASLRLPGDGGILVCRGVGHNIF